MAAGILSPSELNIAPGAGAGPGAELGASPEAATDVSSLAHSESLYFLISIFA